MVSVCHHLLHLPCVCSKCFVVGADNVGSTQMHEIRAAIRPKASLLMGKNTMLRKAMKGHMENIPGLEKYVEIKTLSCVDPCRTYLGCNFKL